MLIQPDAERNVLEDRHGKRLRPLEHHTHPSAQDFNRLRCVKLIGTVKQNPALSALIWVEFKYPVERPKKRRFSTTGRPNHGRDTVSRNIEIDVP